MRTWETQIELAARGDQPLYRRVAAQISDDIARGRLHPGEALPSTRALAAQLEVNRNTIVAAFRVLAAGGWIETRSTSGTYVRDPVPQPKPTTAPPRVAVGVSLPDKVPGQGPTERIPGRLLLLGGVPDLRLVPQRQLARAYAAALRGRRGRAALDYADPQGHPQLRRALAEFLSRSRGIATDASGIAVLRGSQQVLYLAAQSLLRPGDRVAVEALGYPPAWRALRLAGLQLVPIPVDPEGLDISALEHACATQPIQAVLVTPHHQHPTTVTLTRERRRRLMALAARTRMLVIEDDYDHDFHYEGLPILPMAAHDPHQVVLYVGTLSKELAPGLRLGFAAGHPDLIDRLTAYRTAVDVQGDHVLERAIALLLEDGVVQGHARRVRRQYRKRRDALCTALRAQIPDIDFEVPAGGMAVWARAPLTDTAPWVDRALQRGVALQAGATLTYAPGPSPFVRIGFGACTPSELQQAVHRLAEAL